jgi:hypothetical protein
MATLVDRGLGQVDSGGPDLSFLGGSMITAAMLGLGVIMLFSVLDIKPKHRLRRSPRKKYVEHVAKLHKLSKRDQQYLMEHEE